MGKRSTDGREIRTDRDFAAYLLERADLVVVAGEDFGLSPYIRVSFANPYELLKEAGRRLKLACAGLS
jgi:aspartate aminotransferase